MSQLTNAWDLTQAHPEGAEHLRSLALDLTLEALDREIESHGAGLFADRSMAWQIQKGAHAEDVSAEYAASVGEVLGVLGGLKRAREIVEGIKEDNK